MGKIVWRKNGNILKTQLKKEDAQILVLEEQLVSLAQLQQKKFKCSNKHSNQNQEWEAKETQ